MSLKDSPLLGIENVVQTPHKASSTIEAVEETYRGAIANVISYLRGLKPRWMVTPEAH